MALKNLTEQKVKDAFNYQRNNGNWTFYEERKFLENLLQTRFNFLIAVYALFFNAYFLSSVKELKIYILVIGLIFTLLMWFTIYRIYIKVDALLRMLHVIGEEYTFNMINLELGENKNILPNVNRLIGVIIPTFLIITFIAGIVYFFLK